MKYTLLFAMFLGVAIAQHEASYAHDVLGITKRDCSDLKLKRWTNTDLCNSDGCLLCVPNVVVCNVSV